MITESLELQGIPSSSSNPRLLLNWKSPGAGHPAQCPAWFWAHPQMGTRMSLGYLFQYLTTPAPNTLTGKMRQFRTLFG